MSAAWLHSAPRALDGVSPETLRAYEDTALALGRLDATVALAPQSLPRLLLARHTAIATGEGRTGVRALLAARVDPTPEAPRTTAARYAAALDDGAAWARGGRPITSRALGELARLLDPDAPFDPGLVEPLDRLVRDVPGATPPVLKAALTAGALGVLVPFGETTALLSGLAAPLILAAGGAISEPWVCLRPELRTFASLAALERDAAWEPWIRSWCHDAAREARDAERAICAAVARLEGDAARVRALRRVAATVGAVLARLRDEAVVTIPDASDALGITRPTVGASLERLEAMGLAEELTGRGRDRAWASTSALDALAPRAP